LTSTDNTNSVLVGNRAKLEFQDVKISDLSLWKDKTFSLTVNGGTPITVRTDGKGLIGNPGVLTQLDTTNSTSIPANTVVTASVTSFSHIVTNINASIAHELSLLASTDKASGIDVDVVFTTGSNSLDFIIQNGVSNASSSLTLAETTSNSIDLDFNAVLLKDSTGTLQTTFTDLGGETSPTQTVRFVSQIDISTRDSALLAMTVVDAALQTVAANRGLLGAVANRLESTIQNLMTTSENTAASLSRIMDTDYAAESTRLAKAQVLQQASVSILAQANATTQTVLKLLD
jgi:flagellin